MPCQKGEFPNKWKEAIVTPVCNIDLLTSIDNATSAQEQYFDFYNKVYFVVSIEFSSLSTVGLTTNWYQLLKGDYKRILEHSFGKQLPTNFLQPCLYH